MSYRIEDELIDDLETFQTLKERLIRYGDAHGASIAQVAITRVRRALQKDSTQTSRNVFEDN